MTREGATDLKMADVRVGMRLRDPQNQFFPLMTVTRLTDKGFLYDLDRPHSLGSRHGVTTGGEHYGYDGKCLYELVPAPAEIATFARMGAWVIRLKAACQMIPGYLTAHANNLDELGPHAGDNVRQALIAFEDAMSSASSPEGPDDWTRQRIEAGLRSAEPHITVDDGLWLLERLEPAVREGAGGPIALNADQEIAVKSWAADDRLWTTQETVEFNLRTFARKILSASSSAGAAAPRRENEDLS